jgi:hypothetical protein
MKELLVGLLMRVDHMNVVAQGTKSQLSLAGV